MKGKTGAARIALRTGCPVVPIGQWGAQGLMYGPRIDLPKLFPRKTLRLMAGDPVPLDDLRAAPITAATLDEATDRIMDAITALVAELRQQPPPAERYDPRSRADDGRIAVTSTPAAQSGPGRRDGFRLLGHGLRPGAVRRPEPGDPVGPAAGAGRGDQRRASQCRLLPDHRPARDPARGQRSGRGDGGRGLRGPGGALPVVAGQSGDRGRFPAGPSWSAWPRASSWARVCG